VIYLDHSATTWPSEETVAEYARDLGLYTANPASVHRLGQQSARLIRDSKASLAQSLGCRPDEVILTSGGSESINMALKGTVGANPKRGRTIVTLAGEHAATRATLSYLEKQGYVVRKVSLRADGQVDLDQLAAAIDDDTVLITVLLVNNETGVIQPLDQIVAIRNRKRPRAAIHVDRGPGLRQNSCAFWPAGRRALLRQWAQIRRSQRRWVPAGEKRAAHPAAGSRWGTAKRPARWNRKRAPGSVARSQPRPICHRL